MKKLVIVALALAGLVVAVHGQRPYYEGSLDSPFSVGWWATEDDTHIWYFAPSTDVLNRVRYTYTDSTGSTFSYGINDSDVILDIVNDYRERWIFVWILFDRVYMYEFVRGRKTSLRDLSDTIDVRVWELSSPRIDHEPIETYTLHYDHSSAP